MNSETLEKMATSAFENLQHARELLFIETEKAIEAKQALETDKAFASTSGKFDGKNAETREAQAREYLTAQYQAVSDMEHNERRARYAFDKSSIEVETVKTLLRIAELK